MAVVLQHRRGPFREDARHGGQRSVPQVSGAPCLTQGLPDTHPGQRLLCRAVAGLDRCRTTVIAAPVMTVASNSTSAAAGSSVWCAAE